MKLNLKPNRRSIIAWPLIAVLGLMLLMSVLVLGRTIVAMVSGECDINGSVNCTDHGFAFVDGLIDDIFQGVGADASAVQSPAVYFGNLWRTVKGAVANWASVLAGLPRGLLFFLAGAGFGLGLVIAGIGNLLRPGRQPARPTQMSFSGDPRQLRGTVRNPQQQPDGTWRATTTDRQTGWLDHQARRLGISTKEKDKA